MERVRAGKSNKWLDFGSNVDLDSGIFKRIFYHCGIRTSCPFLYLTSQNKLQCLKIYISIQIHWLTKKSVRRVSDPLALVEACALQVHALENDGADFLLIKNHFGVTLKLLQTKNCNGIEYRQEDQKDIVIPTCEHITLIVTFIVYLSLSIHTLINCSLCIFLHS